MPDVYPKTSVTAPAPTDVAQFRSKDVDHARSVLNRFYYPIAVGVPDGAEGFGLDMRMIQVGPLTVGRLSFAGPVTLTAVDLDAYHVTMPIRGRVRARHAGHEVMAEPSIGAVFGPSGRIRTLHSARSSQLDIKIERAALDAELAGLLGRPLDGPIDLPPSITLSDGPARSWRRLVRLLHDEAGQPHSLLAHPLIADRMRHAVMTGLLFSVPHRYCDALRAPARPGAPRAVQRAVDAIHDEPERSFTVADLAEIAGVSVRSLQEGFRRHVGCSPMAYLQQARLARVHEELGSADPSLVTVAAVAHRWGFAHLGRFASAYRARFGIPPSTRLRGTPDLFPPGIEPEGAGPSTSGRHGRPGHVEKGPL